MLLNQNITKWVTHVMAPEKLNIANGFQVACVVKCIAYWNTMLSDVSFNTVSLS